MRSGLVVEHQIAFHALMRSPNRLVGVQIHLLVFDTFPASFHTHVIPPATFSVHAHLNAVVGQEPRELLAGELASLVGVEDLGAAILRERLPHCVETEVRRQRVGEPPRQHAATRPVQDGEEIDEASTHGNGGDIGRPDVVRANDVQIAQEIGGDPMGRMPLSGAGLAIHGGDPYAPHEAGHMPPSNGVPLVPKQIAEHPGPGKGILERQRVNPPHQRQLCRRDRHRVVVRRRARHAEQLALPDDRQRMSAVDHRGALSKPALVSAPSQQSCSRASCPIFA
jgi:hypothetical protein